MNMENVMKVDVSQRSYETVCEAVMKPLVERDSHRVSWLWGQARMLKQGCLLNLREYEILEEFIGDNLEKYEQWSQSSYHGPEKCAQALLKLKARTLDLPATACSLEDELIWHGIKALALRTPGGLTPKKARYVEGLNGSTALAARYLIHFESDRRLRYSSKEDRYYLPGQERPNRSKRTSRFFKLMNASAVAARAM